MRQTLELKINIRGHTFFINNVLLKVNFIVQNIMQKKACQNLRRTYLNKSYWTSSYRPCLFSVPVNRFTLEIFLAFDWLGWARHFNIIG